MLQKLRFKILLTILPVTVILLISSAMYHYNIMKENLLEHYAEIQQTTEDHIVDAINLIDSGYRMLETRLESDLAEKAKTFLSAYNRVDGNLNRLNINHLKVQEGYEYDFMVIDENAVITHSTIREALNFNFAEFDPVLGEKINSIRRGDEIWYEQVRTNVGTGKLSKFAYIPTDDHKYLLEIAYSVDGFHAVTEDLMPNSIIERMISLSPMIKDIKMYDAYGYQIVDSGDNYEPTPESVEIVERARHSDYSISGSDHMRRKFIYINLNQNREQTMANTDRVVEIVYDESVIEHKLWELWKSILIGSGVVLLFLALGILYITKKLTKPVEALTEVSLQIADGNYAVTVEENGNDEVGELARAFNLMVGEINQSFLKIETQNEILENYNRNLEKMVSERTNELQERNQELELKNHELEIAWIKANEATESKSNFLAMISHEIRTPINGIIGMAYLMARTKLSVKQGDYIQKIKGSAENLLEIINDVLDISKLEAGKIALEKNLFSTEQIYEMISNQLGYKCSQKNIELIFNNDSELPLALVGDSLRLRQVLTNLINNAIKFTEVGEIIVSTKVLEKENERIRVRFEVSDTGIGIDPSKLKLLFNPFQQADDSISRKYGGTGLGLSICKHFVGLMDGEIWVESQINKGSQFFFTAVFEVPNGQNPPRDSIKGEIENLRILLVDDSETTREVLKEMLKIHAQSVDAVSSGEEAISLVERRMKQNGSYDLILMDWKLPGIDGIDATYEIKRKMNMRKIPSVLMLTGFDLDEVKNHDKSRHIDAFLSKPVIKGTLMQTISQMMNKEMDDDSVLIEVIKTLEAKEDVYVLLAEDNLINQQIIRELLEHPLFHVDVVSNGESAVNSVQQYEYDIVLMDIQMPELDGLRATEKIRASKKNSEVPIIAMTAHAMEEDRIKCLNAGMNDYMSKPVEAEQFFEMMCNWVEKDIKIKEVEGEKIKGPSEMVVKLSSFQTKAPIASLHGNWNLYIKLLKEFYKKYALARDEMQRLFSDGKQAEMKAIVHSIRGIAGNLGAMNLFISAQTLETDFNKGNVAMTSDNMKSFLDEVSNVMKDIRLINHEETTEQGVLDGTGEMTSNELLDLLRNLLREGSSEAENYVSAIRKLDGVIENRELLIQQIENYDFDDALETLEQEIER